MNILGLSGGIKIGNQDGAAALVVDGQLVAAAEEERFLGIKFANGQLPRHAISFCLAQSGLRVEDLDVVVFAGATYERFDEILSDYFGFQFGHAPPIVLVDHHSAHAASAWYGTDWDDGLVLTMDFSGDRKATTVSRGTTGGLVEVEAIHKPNSLGIFYSAITQYLGFQRDSDEYKVMGMAAYGQPRFDLDALLAITSHGYELQHRHVRGITADQPSPSKQERLYGDLPLDVAPRVPGSVIDAAHYDLAASAQQQLERAVISLLERHLTETGCRRVAIAGGVGLNCLMNRALRQLETVDELFVPPVCSDAGLALGGALLESNRRGVVPETYRHAYWGPEFSAGEIRAVLDRAGATYREVGQPAVAVAELIARGKIVGRFDGRMEYGPRALGNRSILASPRDAEMKDKINSRIKFREEFRPLAPSVRHEDGSGFFTDYADSPYMTQCFLANDRAVEEAPAVVHADGTSRLQSVHTGTNPAYDELIAEVGRQTGLPMVLNTSLNAYNDPMACQPHQALRTYFVTGLDAIVLGSFVLEKN